MPHRNYLLNLLHNYRCNTEEESAKLKNFISFVEKSPDCFHRSNLEGHITASALLFSPDKKSVLLTHHKKIGQWLQLGGHADGMIDPFEVALKEAKEESGINEIYAESKTIFDFDIHFIEKHKNDPAHYHYDLRYIMHSRSFDFIVSEESNTLEWVLVKKILESDLYEPSLKRMIKKSCDQR